MHLIVLLAAACGAEAPAGPPHVILVSLDTLRADALGAYGNERGASPHIDGFLAEAALFRNAYASEPHTLPSHVSLFTSLPPLAHGVEARMRGGRSLPEHVPTLATMLSERGYDTAAFINGGFLHPKFGLAHGFDHYDYFSDTKANEENLAARFGRSAKQTNQDVFDWLDAADAGPKLLFVHFFDVHSDWGALPYDAPTDDLERFRGETRLAPEEHAGAQPSQVLRNVNAGAVELESWELEDIRAMYAAGLAYTDRQFGRLIDGLKERGMYDDAVIVLVSDHGEEFLEHGRMLHTQLYGECMRVPLGIKAPASAGFSPTARSEYVQMIDVLPTTLDLLGIEPPRTALGRSLAPLLRDEPGFVNRPVFHNSSIDNTLAMIDDGWKLVLRPGDLGAELYDLANDPAEQTDLAASQPERLAAAIERLLAWRDRLPRLSSAAMGEAVELDEDTLEALEAIGYMK